MWWWGDYWALWDHVVSQECVLSGCQAGSHFCVCHADTCMAGSATNAKQSQTGLEDNRNWGPATKFLENGMRTRSEIRSHCLLWEGGALDSPWSPSACISFQWELCSISHLPSLPSTHWLLLCLIAIPRDKRHILLLEKKSVDVLPGLKSKIGERKIPTPFFGRKHRGRL